MLISSDGIIIRIPADGISKFARPSKGVRVMRVSEGEKIVTLTPVEKEEEETPSEENAEGGAAQTDENNEIESNPE